MFYEVSEFNTNGQHVIERGAYVAISDGPKVFRGYRNVYENEDGEWYVRYAGFIVKVSEYGEIWCSD